MNLGSKIIGFCNNNVAKVFFLTLILMGFSKFIIFSSAQSYKNHKNTPQKHHSYYENLSKGSK